MTQQLSSEKTSQNMRNIPDSIILATTVMIDALRWKIKALTDMEISEEEILQIIIQALAYDKNVQLEIDVTCEMVARQHLGAAFEESAEETAVAMSEFGSALYKELKRLNAYQNGYLFYQFMQMDGKDVVLTRMIPPEIHK